MLVGRGGNIGLTVGTDGAAIIDDQFADMAPKIRAAVAMLSDQPVKFVINTHLHGDHTGGNDAFGKAGAVIIAHENVRKRLGTDAGESVHQRSPFRRARARRCRSSRSPIRRRCISTTTISSSRTCRMRTPRPTSSSASARRTCCTWATCFTGGFPFIDGNTGGTLDGLIRAHETVLPTVDDNTKIIRGHGPLGNKAELQAYHDMLVVVRDRVAKLVKAGKSQDEVVAARPTKEFEEKYGGTNFNAAQWIGRAYVDQKIALEKRKKK